MIFRNHLFKNRVPLMNRALDAYALRLRTISKNITNVNSPHYRPEMVKFEELFHKQDVVLKGANSDEKHIPIGKSPNDVEGEVNPTPIPEPEIYFSGETHVNIDKEMSELAQNQIRFQFVSQQMARFFRGLSSAITGNPGQNI